MTDTLSTLTVEAGKYYDRLLIDRLLPICRLPSLGQMRDLPKRQGSTVSYRKFASLSTATTALSEGTTPSGASLSVTEVTGTVYQYGNFVTLSDALDQLAIDPIVTESIDVLGENAGESIEEIIRATVITGSNIKYGGTRTSRNTLTATDVMTLTLVRKAVRDLVAAKAKPFYGSRDEKTGQGGQFVGYIHPNAWYDLTGDSTVLNTFVYSDPEKLYSLELPVLAGVAWIVSSKAPYFAGAGAASADVYGALIFGKDAFGVGNIGNSGGKNFETIISPLGSAGSADPLKQRSAVGWKTYQCVKILNEGAIQRIEVGATA